MLRLEHVKQTCWRFQRLLYKHRSDWISQWVSVPLPKKVSPMSPKRCVSVFSEICLYNQVDKVEQVSPLSLMRCVSVLVMELALGGSATNRATSSSLTSADTHKPWPWPCSLGELVLGVLLTPLTTYMVTSLVTFLPPYHILSPFLLVNYGGCWGAWVPSVRPAAT